MFCLHYSQEKVCKNSSCSCISADSACISSQNNALSGSRNGNWSVNDDNTYAMGIISGVKSSQDQPEVVPKMGVDVSPNFETKLESVSSIKVKCTSYSKFSVSELIAPGAFRVKF